MENRSVANDISRKKTEQYNDGESLAAWQFKQLLDASQDLLLDAIGLAQRRIENSMERSLQNLAWRSVLTAAYAVLWLCICVAIFFSVESWVGVVAASWSLVLANTILLLSLSFFNQRRKKNVYN